MYGSKGALICRLVEENGICESLKAATADQVEFRELDVPDRVLSAGRQQARVVAVAVLREPRAARSSREILSDGPENEGNFEDGAHVQELINAVEHSFRERRWVSIPLDGAVSMTRARSILRSLLRAAAGERDVHRRARRTTTGFRTGRPPGSRRWTTRCGR